MTRKFSQSTRSLPRQILLILLISEGILFLISLALLFFGGSHAIKLFIALLAVLIFIIGLSVEFFFYQSEPKVKEKNQLRSLAQKADRNVATCKSTQLKLQKALQSLNEKDNSETKSRTARYNTDRDKFLDQREELPGQEKQTISDSLLILQKQYIQNGLRLATLNSAKIDGVGPKLKERLLAHGIHNASDVNQGRIVGIPGFGDAKVQSVLQWRSFVDNQLNRNKPTSLPADQLTEIKQRFARRLVEIDESIKQTDDHFNSDIEEIKSRYQLERQQREFELSHAMAELQDAQNQASHIHSELNKFAKVTFPNFLIGSLGISPTGAQRTTLLGGLLTLLLAAAGYQSIQGAASTASLIIASIPTSTATSTVTLTPTFTATATSTLTPTRTNTSTFTPSPTFTLTPTITFTPVATWPTEGQFFCIPQDTVRQVGKVVDVVDGDTIKVRFEDGQIISVRYIGIDTSEQGQPFYQESKNANYQLVYNKDVALVQDVSLTDQYDRLLRYVIVGETFVNYELILKGFAYASSHPPDVSCQSIFTNAQVEARKSKAGLWNPTPTAIVRAPVVPVVPVNPVVPTVPPRSGGGNCHPSYPDFCIAPPPPDLDCGDIGRKRFTVLPPDPHGFDGDNDGIGCES